MLFLRIFYLNKPQLFYNVIETNTPIYSAVTAYDCKTFQRTSQRAHNFETTPIRRWLSVLTLNQRWIDVLFKLNWRCLNVVCLLGTRICHFTLFYLTSFRTCNTMLYVNISDYFCINCANCLVYIALYYSFTRGCVKRCEQTFAICIRRQHSFVCCNMYKRQIRAWQTLQNERTAKSHSA